MLKKTTCSKEHCSHDNNNGCNNDVYFQPIKVIKIDNKDLGTGM